MAQEEDKLLYKSDLVRAKLGLLGPQDWSSISKFFIVSTGRTGTQFLARFFNRFPGVYANHEPNPDFLELAIEYAKGAVSTEKAIETIERTRRAMFRRIKRKDASIYVESNNRFFSLLVPLQDAFSDFKIIHLIRDGRDYVRSGMSRPWYTERDPYEGKRMKATCFADDEYNEKWAEMSRFEKIAWRWQKKDAFILRDLKSMSNVLTLKFEELFQSEDYKGLRKMCEYIGLPTEETNHTIEQMISEKINATDEYTMPRWTDWDSELIQKFDTIAGTHMRKYYEDYSWDTDVEG